MSTVCPGRLRAVRVLFDLCGLRSINASGIPEDVDLFDCFLDFADAAGESDGERWCRELEGELQGRLRVLRWPTKGEWDRPRLFFLETGTPKRDDNRRTVRPFSSPCSSLSDLECSRDSENDFDFDFDMARSLFGITGTIPFFSWLASTFS
eukprot:209354-Amorphochlora_amoeboformis.AAC.2